VTVSKEDEALSLASFEFEQGGLSATVRRQDESTWYVYGSGDRFVGYFALAYASAGKTEPEYTAGLPDELLSTTDPVSHDWRELVVWLLSFSPKGNS
jgi:hypothetical protein